jgi:hypothetical protein
MVSSFVFCAEGALLLPFPGESRDPLFRISGGGEVGPGFRREALIF